MARAASGCATTSSTEEVIRPEEYAGQLNAVRGITERFTAALERLVRGFPEKYFWLHRSRKHQPQPPKGKKAV
jgi:KDO2-lipid IV(A) lauroyltransferase